MADRWGYHGVDHGQYDDLTDAELRSTVANRLRLGAAVDRRPPAEAQLLNDVADLLDRLNEEAHDADEG